MPRITLVRGSTILGALLLAACASEGARAAAGRDTVGAEARAAAAARATLFGSGAPAPASVGVAAEARRACDAIAAAWASVPADSMRRDDTEFHPVDLVGDSVVYQGDRPRVAACGVDALLRRQADSTARARGASWVSSGWSEIPRLFTPGEAEGSEHRHYQRERTRCTVWTEEGGDGEAGEDESDAAPDPYFAAHVLCWRHWRDLAPADTAAVRGGGA